MSALLQFVLLSPIHVKLECDTVVCFEGGLRVEFQFVVMLPPTHFC